MQVGPTKIRTERTETAPARAPSGSAPAPAPRDVHLAGDLPRANLLDAGDEPRKQGFTLASAVAAAFGRGDKYVAAVLLGAVALPAIGVAINVDSAHAATTANLTTIPADAEVAKEVLFAARSQDRSPEERELIQKLSAYVQKHHQGDYKKGFGSFDENGDKALGRGELGNLLKAAGVGNVFTRGAWVDGILERFDKSPKNGKIAWIEVEHLFTE